MEYPTGAGTIRIETEGLSGRDVVKLEAVVRGFAEVSNVNWTTCFPASDIRARQSVPLNPATQHLIVSLAEGAFFGIGTAASSHFYKKVGEAIVDRVWDAVKTKFGNSEVEVGVKLYGPDGQLIKQHRREQ
jgi:hypothetical protein